MTNQEVIKLLTVVKNTYPSFQPEDLNITAEIWCEMLKDYDYNTIMASLKSYMIGNPSQFAPSVGQLINGIYDVQHRNDMTAEEAWSIAYKAIGNSAYNSQEEFDKLPRSIQRALGSPSNMKEIALKEGVDYQVEKSVFVKSYRNAVAMERQNALIPSDVKAVIDTTTQAMLEDRWSDDPEIGELEMLDVDYD